MRTPAILLAGVLACLIVTASCDSNHPSPLGTSQSEPSGFARDLTGATNEERRDRDLSGLQPSACLMERAKKRAKRLVGGELTHAPLTGVLEACGGTRAAENLVRTLLSPEDVVEEWLRSPGHRNNIIDPSFTKMSTACVRTRGRYLCVQLFVQSG